MVELIGVHRADQADVVDDLAEVRQDVGDLAPRSRPCAAKRNRGPEHGRVGTDERVTLPADDRRRNRLALEFGQLRLVIEEVEMARAPGHEEMNHRLRPPAVVRALRDQRFAGVVAAAAPDGVKRAREQPGQRDPSQPDAALLEEPAARDALAGRSLDRA